MNKYLDKAGLQDYTTKLTAKYDTRYATHAMVGSPLVAQTAADMTDTDKVYVYTGSETGYTNGDWYYYDGSAWQDGGVYNSAAVVLDDTLTQPDEAAEAKAVGDALANKANIDGSYADLTAGNAEALVTNLSETSLTPYNFQTTGGSVETGNRVNIKKVIYGSVVVNQLLKLLPSASYPANGITATQDANGVITLSGTTTTTYAAIFASVNYQAGHKYLLGTRVIANPNNVSCKLNLINASKNGSVPVLGSYSIINTVNSGNTTVGFTNLTANTDLTGIKFIGYIIDLTQWYGSTETADHIYLMESASAGRGVSFMQTQYPVLNGGYIPCNTGTLLSSNPSKHEANGFNWWDEETEIGIYNSTTGQKENGTGTTLRSKNYFRVIPSATIYVSAPTDGVFLFAYDINKEYIGRYNGVAWVKTGGLNNNGNMSIQVPDNCYYLTLLITGGYGTTYKGDICVSDHWDDTRNGDYEAWVLHPYPIDNTVDGHGIFKFKPQAASPWTYTDHLTDEMYVDGDTLEPDGTFTENYTYRAYESGDESLANAITDGTHTAVKKVTPTTSAKDPYQETMIVDNWGWEILNDYAYDNGDRAVQIPVGTESVYPVNLVDKLEAAPDNPTADGFYIVKKNGNSTEYVAYVGELPSDPASDGTYTLKATVSSGSVTKSWVADA